MADNTQTISHAQTAPVAAVKQGRNHHLILTAMSVSSAGDWLYRLALPIMVLKLTGSANATAAMYMMEFAPYIVLGPMAGAIADRVNRKVLLVMLQVLATLISGVIAIIVMQDWVSFGLLLGIGALLASTQVFFYPALQGLIKSSVPPAQLASLNARLQSIQSLFGVIGPAFGAAIVTFFGVSGAVVLDAISFLIAALVLAFVSYEKRSANAQAKEPESISRMIVGGVKYLRTNRPLLAGIFLFGGANFGLMMMQSNLIYVVLQYLHTSNLITGIVLGCGGIGAIVGAAIASRINQKVKPGKAILLSILGTGLLTCAMLVQSWVFLAIMWACISVLISVIVVTWMSYQQRNVPSEMLGRVSSIGRMVSYLAIPFGAMTGGFLVGNFQSLLLLAVVAGGAQVLTAILGRFSPLWNVEHK